jgi:DNA-binding Xre family transcriptional regulator
MANTAEETRSISQELEEMAKGALTAGYQTAIMQIMQRVEEEMRRLGMSRSELAERLGVHPSRVTRLLDDPDNITLRTLWRICGAVGLKPSISVD